MTVATFTQTNSATSGGQTGAQYLAALDGDISVLANTAAMFAPHEASTPNMTVVVDAGAQLVSGARVANAAQISATITAPASGYNRKDRVVRDQLTGIISVVTGTPTTGVASAPAIPAGKFPCVQVALTSSATAITNSMLTDERCLGGLSRAEADTLYQGAGSYAALAGSSSQDFAVKNLTVAGTVPTWNQSTTGSAATLNNSTFINALTGDVNLSSTASYFDGPSIAQGISGRWYVSGKVTFGGGTVTAFDVKLWDGTNVIDSTYVDYMSGNGQHFNVHLSGIISNPAGNLKISVKAVGQTDNKITFNVSGEAKDSTISAFSF